MHRKHWQQINSFNFNDQQPSAIQHTHTHTLINSLTHTHTTLIHLQGYAIWRPTNGVSLVFLLFHFSCLFLPCSSMEMRSPCRRHVIICGWRRMGGWSTAPPPPNFRIEGRPEMRAAAAAAVRRIRCSSSRSPRSWSPLWSSWTASKNTR